MTDREEETKTGVSRRGVLGGTAVAGAAALSGGAYLESLSKAKAALPTEVKPGDLDE
jgi:nitrous oxide reductase